MTRYLFGLAACLATPLWAQAGPQALSPIIVTSAPFGDRTALEATQPAEVLAGAELERHVGATLGETLSGLAGVHGTDFGAGASRPVIRGLGGPRIRVLESGTGIFDASAISPDHNAASEPLRAGQIEVLRGPATLLYGSGAIGGVINVVTDLIPDRPAAGIHGSAGARGTTVDDGESYWGRLTAGTGPWAVHLDGIGRSAQDYAIPGTADADGDPAGGVGRVHDTALDTESFGLGAGWADSDGHLGVGATRYATVYEVPGHDHAGPAGTRIDLDHTRYQVSGDWRRPFAAFERVRGEAAFSDYTHRELDGGADTVFSNQAAEVRMQLTHQPIGTMRGVLGAQFIQQNFAAEGDGAFVPSTDTSNSGVFAVEEHEFGHLTATAGARLEAVEHRPDAAAPGRDFGLVTLAGGLRLPLADGHQLTLNLTRAQRAPDAQELYAHGPHRATLSYESGDADLRRETALNLDAGAHGRWGALGYSLSLFHTRYRDYIFATEVDQDNLPGADRVDRDGNPQADGELLVLNTVQRNARFTGGEAELSARIIDAETATLDVRIFGDWVTARLSGGDNLPRTPPRRYGLAVNGVLGAITFGVDVTGVARQSDTAPLESATAGYTLLGAHAGWSVHSGGGEFRITVAGTNLLDETARNHVSVLKDVAPLPGSGVRMAVEYRF